jgi:toxin ParE1/3/4
MPYHVVFAPEANAHLIGIYRYIASNASPTIAERFTAAIVDYCETFNTFPHRGLKRDDLRSGLRTIGFRRRVTVAFTVEHDKVTIVGVFYGGQNYEDTLQLDDEVGN